MASVVTVKITPTEHRLIGESLRFLSWALRNRTRTATDPRAQAAEVLIDSYDWDVRVWQPAVNSPLDLAQRCALLLEDLGA